MRPPQAAAVRQRRRVDELDDGNTILPPLESPLDAILTSPWHNSGRHSANDDPLTRRLLPIGNALSLRRPRTSRESYRKTLDVAGLNASAIRVEMLSCDGGSLDFDDSGRYNAENCLQDNSAVYCTAKLENVNILLKSAGSRAFTLSRIVIKAPQRSFTSPVKDGIIFVSMSRIDCSDTRPYDRLDTGSEFSYGSDDGDSDLRKLLEGQELPYTTTSLNDAKIHKDIIRPAAYFVVDSRTGCAVIEFEPAISGRYVHIKLLSGQQFDSHSGRFTRDNIDLQAILLYGYGRRVFPKFEFR